MPGMNPGITEWATKMDRAKRFVRRVARMSLSGECASCHRSGDVDNPRCRTHKAFVPDPDHEAAAIVALVKSARRLLAEL